MKRVRDILLAVVAVMVAVACGESRYISDTLEQAEAVMQEYPDSALTLLQAINTDELTTDRGRAMHALLLSQAYDKNYIDLTDDLPLLTACTGTCYLVNPSPKTLAIISNSSINITQL